MAKILVVDDARVMRFHISKIITQLGHTVTAEAKDGCEALEEYKKQRPDFVTMDVNMPTVGDVHGGIEAVERIIEYDSKAIIIMVSAQTDEEHVAQAIRQGAKNYLKKPITADKLKKLMIFMGFHKFED